MDCACSCHCLSFSCSIAFFSSFFTFLQYSISALVIWIAPRCSGKRQFRLLASVCFAPENALSQGANDAGTARMSCAIVDSEETTTMVLILNQLQFKNLSEGLKETLSPVYHVLTMTRQNHKDRILDIKLEKMIPILPQYKASVFYNGSYTVAHHESLLLTHSKSLQ